MILCYTSACLDDVGKQLQFAHTCVLSAITCGKLTKLVAVEKHFDPGHGLLETCP